MPPNTIYTFETWGSQILDFLSEVVGDSAFLICNSVGGAPHLTIVFFRCVILFNPLQLRDSSWFFLNVDKCRHVEFGAPWIFQKASWKYQPSELLVYKSQYSHHNVSTSSISVYLHFSGLGSWHLFSENPSGNAFLRLCVQEYRSHHSLQSCPIAPAFWCGAGCYASHIGCAEDRAFGLLGSRHRRATSCSHGVR